MEKRSKDDKKKKGKIEHYLVVLLTFIINIWVVGVLVGIGFLASLATNSFYEEVLYMIRL